MEIKNPIFIIGIGRSGSTLLHEMLADHPKAVWMSKLCQYFPSRPEINRCFLKVIDWPIIGSLLKKKIHPREYYEFWEYWQKGFSVVCRDLFADDVTPSAHYLKEAFTKMISRKRNRLIVKITGWPRIGFLKEIFPDAKFIHILRDGRSVSSSMLNQTWWWGWRGPENWRWGQLSESQYQLWNKYEQSFVVLAAIEWMILMDSFEKASVNLSRNDYKLIKYESLCDDSLNVVQDIIEFCDLEWTDEFAGRIQQYRIKNASDKWKTELNSKQQHDLQEVLSDYLQKYGYK